MKILTSDQIRELDECTILNEPIESIDLMERASTRCVDWLVNKYDKSFKFIVFCGVGNNGGDGLAISRLLISLGYEVMIYIVKFSDRGSEDFETNYTRLKDLGVVPHYLSDGYKDIELPSGSVIIDAIFGSGLKRPITGYIVDIVQLINNDKNVVVSIDIPSGLFGEGNTRNKKDNIIKANYTLTFQHPRLSMMFQENYKYVGEFEVLDIGLHSDGLDTISANFFYIEKNDVKSILMKRGKFDHKGSFGHTLIIAGSVGKMGAAILSAKGCLRAGAGLLTIQIPKIGLNAVQVAIPEAMCIPDSSMDQISELTPLDKYRTIGVGPGLGMGENTIKVVKDLLSHYEEPIVIDADAVNILSENLEWLSLIPNDSVLTPHPKEFERLVGAWSSDEERLEKQQMLSKENNLIVVLKGAHTCICFPDGSTYFNSTGNPGMATAGSGDVLTGIIASLLGQGYSPKESALVGVYLHGLSGDFAAEELTANSMIAGDICDYLSCAYKKILE